jgi:16S rRNA (uracil1498-N3)-methyltransferase
MKDNNLVQPLDSSHIFSCYYPYLSDHIEKFSLSQFVTITDKDLWHRLVRVLRLETSGSFILFDQFIHMHVKLEHETFQKKGNIVVSVSNIKKNQALKPSVVLACGLLKKEAFEKIVYFGSQMGADQIIPLIATRVHRSWGNQKELERLRRISVAACEQSKQYVFPELCNPLNIESFFTTIKSTSDACKKICFESTGHSLFTLLDQIHRKPPQKIVIVVGPEGGFTSSELDQFKQGGFEFYALTPTILRSVEAVNVGLGSIRSVASFCERQKFVF